MARDVISAKLDIIFKKLFSEHEDLLQDFLEKILDFPTGSIKIIKIVNSELTPEAIGSKFSRLDLNMKVDDKLINVEMQVRNEPDFRDRSLFYWSKLYTSELKEGEEYGALKQAITINIINFNMFDGDDYHTEVGTIIKGTGEVFSDKFKMHFFELKKVSKKPNASNRKELWLQFLNADSEEDFEMVNQTNVPIMQKAVSLIYDMSSDAQIREAARLREKALHDEASALKGARDEGRAEGRAERDAEIIFRLKSKGMTDEQIKELLS